jgi:ABC-type spermidine/putrescine transport system permease subunit II
MSVSAATEPFDPRVVPPPKPSRLRELLLNPWGQTRFLWLVGIGYVVWTLVPVGNAVLFSFNSARSLTQWGGFSLRWYVTDPSNSIAHDPALSHAIVQSLKLATLTALIAVPIGVAFALALHRWRSRTARAANFTMMFSFVTPELILAVSLFLLLINAFKMIGLGTTAQLIGLIVLALAYPVVIVRARLLSLGSSYEEAALDLGASPVRTLGRVTLPLLGPSILASGAIVFALTLDDFVIVDQLSRDAGDQTVSMAIYGAARTGPTPASNAIGTIMLTASTIIIAIAFVVYRRTVRRREGAEAMRVLPA